LLSSACGGWSQARYQRHIENFHLQHVKEVIDTLDALVRDEEIEHIVAAGPDDALALLHEHLPAHLADKLEATTKLDLAASDAEVLQATLESFREHQGDTEAEQAQINAREEVEKSRIGNERAISEARIASERDVRQREIERRWMP